MENLELNQLLSKMIGCFEMVRMVSIRGGTVHVFVPNHHGTGISVRCMMLYDEYRQFTPNPEGGARSNTTLFDNRQQKNGDTEAGALMFGSLYFILIKYQLAVKLAMLELMCVRECVCVWRDHFNCFLIPAESTLNTYCLINYHCIKVCFYLWKQNGFYIYNM